MMIFVLLPAYNEEKNIDTVIEEIQEELKNLKRDFRLVVVNDGSTDGTFGLLQKHLTRGGIEIINFEKNRGVGAVFRTGIKRISEIASYQDILISMDCDRTHPANTFRNLLGALDEGSDIAIASRYHPASKTVNLPFMRAFLSDGINTLLRTCFPVKGTIDYTTFFRAYKIEILKKAFKLYADDFIQNKGFACMAEILLKLRVFNPVVREVPVNLRFDLRTGKSKMKIFKTIYGYLSLIAKESIDSIQRRFSKRRYFSIYRDNLNK